MPSLVSPFGLYLMWTFAAEAIPIDLLEAARINGAGELRIFARICLPLLAPGVGAQGGTTEDLRRVFGDALPNVLPASSRDVLSAGPDVAALRDRALRTSESLAALLR